MPAERDDNFLLPWPDAAAPESEAIAPVVDDGTDRPADAVARPRQDRATRPVGQPRLRLRLRRRRDESN